MKKILVIEDDREVSECISYILDAENYWGIYADNGCQGVELAIAHLPDLIICDIMMPELDGYGVLKQLQESRDTATIPFIFLTGKSTKSDRYRGMKLGADDYITKPFMQAELLSAIATRLKKKDIHDRTTDMKLDRLRSSIALSLPHELRTPLNGILVSSELLKEDLDVLETHEVLELVENIHISAKRLNHLTINFLLYADLELIKNDPKRLQSLQEHSTEYPSLAIREVSTTLARKINPSRESDLCFNLEDATVRISHQSLIKVIEELVDNALKFSSPGTEIRITSKIEEDRYHFSIGDRGRGMSIEQIANLGAYQQFDRKYYEQQGSGLGLTIVKQLVDLYGGKLRIESVVKAYTIIHLTLPMIQKLEDSPFS